MFVYRKSYNYPEIILKYLLKKLFIKLFLNISFYLIKYLSTQVDQTEKGWFIQYIDRDPLVLKRQKELEKARMREQDDEERHAR